jgi:hypothetical protein
METRHCWHGGDAVASELRKLLTLCCVNVDKAVHVADAETLDTILGVFLPLRS